MIRTHEWKYVHRYPYGPHELYDLAHDPGERVNLLEDARVWDEHAPDRKQVAAAMKMRLESWFEKYTDPQMDARLQPITGRGQLHFVGSKGRGQPAFHETETKKVL